MISAAPNEASAVSRRSPKSAAHSPKAHRVNDACRALGIGRALFYNLRAQGKIRTIKIGNRTLVTEAELDRLVSGGD
jgi:excisionase family DNA binding protein